MKKIMKRTLLLLVCIAMLLPAFCALTAFAEDQKSWEDTWRDELCPAYMATSFKTVEDRLKGDGNLIVPMTLYCVVEGVAMYGDPVTGEMVFLNLTNPEQTKEDIDAMEGAIPEYTAYYTTNPIDAGFKPQNGSGTSEAVKEKLYSQLIIQYTQNASDMEMNSFADAAANQQIKTSNIRGGVRVEYSIGREQVLYLVPRQIRYDKFEALLEQVKANSSSARDASVLRAFYILYDLNDTTKAQKTLDSYKEQYPVLEKFAIYACEKTIASKELLRCENFIKLYTDYTYEQMEEDHAEAEYESSEENPPLFKLAIEYKVDGEGGITIRLNAGNIRFDSTTYTLRNVVLLPYGGAGNTANEGYIFTPDGSGSLISFKDAANSSSKTSTMPMYGPDYAYHTITGANRELMYLPVYGVVESAYVGTHEEDVPQFDDDGNPLYETDSNGDPKLDDDGNPIPVTKRETLEDYLDVGFLAVIEEGDSLSKITVNNGGSLHPYISVYTTFNPRPQDTYALSGGIMNDANATWTVESKRKYTGDYKIRLFMLDQNDVSYSAMARTYREYLIKKGILAPVDQEQSDEIPLYLETLGSMEIVEHVLGIPVLKMIALTSFKDDIEILEELKESQISNVKLKLNGWCNGGLFFTVPTRVKFEKVMGGEDGFKELVAYAKQQNVTLFPDFDFSYVYAKELFDGLDADEDLAKTIDDRTARLREYDPTWQGYIENGTAVLSPYAMEPFYDKMYKKYETFDIGAIAVCTLGNNLNSDFNEDDPLTREDSKVLVKRLLTKISEQNEKVLVSGGNVYTLPFVTDLIDVPMDDSRSNSSCASIPFMAMVLHGYKEYAGSPLNLAANYTYSVLKAVENGASPYFIIGANNTSELKDYTYSRLANYYSTRYTIWKQAIAKVYNLLNEVLASVKYETIEQHEFLDHDMRVAVVTYSNGEKFYVNYLKNDFDIKIDGKAYSIPENGFLKVCENGDVLTYKESAIRQ